ncbi:hypothetical protein ABPG74_003199 [Tetrahymena malaccensis]
MIDSDTAVLTTIIFAVVCLIYSIVMAFVKKFFGNVAEDYKKLKTGQVGGTFSDREALLVIQTLGADQRALSFQDSCKRLLKESLFLFTYQSISMLIVATIFCLTFLIWFSLDSQYLWLFLPFLVGLLITSLCTFLVILLTSQSRARVLFTAQDDKEVTFSEGYIINNSITTGILSIFILTLLLVIPKFEKWYFEDFDQKKYQQNFYFNSLSFSLGVCLASLFYRDLGGNLSKGISIGSTQIDEQLKDIGTPDAASAHNNLKYGEIIGNYFSHNVTSTLDLMSLISTLIVATNILSTGKDDTDNTTFNLLVYLMSLNVLITFVVSWLSKLASDKFQLQPTSSFIAKQIRIQYIVINIISFILLFFLPSELVPTKISIGKDGTKNPSFFDSDISEGDLIWCLQIGQVISFLIILFYEVWTSYGFSLVRRVSKQFRTTSFSYGVAYAESQSNVAACIIIFILAATVYFAYYFGGVFGLNWITIGILQSAPLLLGVCFFSLATSDSVTTAGLNGLEHFCTRLRLINWATNNFSSLIQLLNIAGNFFANLLIIASIVQITKAQATAIFNGGILVGFLIGCSMILLISYVNTLGIQHLASKMVDESNNFKIKISQSHFENLNKLILSSFTPSFYTVLLNLIIVVSYILFTAMILGTSATIGFTIGLTLFGLIFSLRQLIVGYSLKNAQNYIDQSNLIGENEFKQSTTSSKDSGYIAQALYQIPGTGLYNYINLALMVFILGAQVFQNYGYFDSYMAKNSSELSGSTTSWYLDSSDSSADAKAKKLF